jgi:hypothetical protein
MKYRIVLVGLFLTGLLLIEKNYFFQKSGLAMLGVVFVAVALILFAFSLYSKISNSELKGKKNGTLIFLLLFASIIVFMALTNFFYRKFRKNQLANEGRQLNVRIDSINYEKRGKIEGHFMYYRYTVDRIDYEFSNQVDTTQFALFDTLTINYLPQRPEIHEIAGTINENGKIGKKN